MHQYRLIWTYREHLSVKAEFKAAINEDAVKIGLDKFRRLPSLTLHGSYKIQRLLIGTKDTWVILDAQTGEELSPEDA